MPQIYDDPKGQSISIIQTLFTEMSGLFPDGVFDVGGDETGHTPPCSLNNTRSFEEKMIAYVTQDLGKKVMGWEELLFKTGAANATKSTVIDSWARSNWNQAAARGYNTVVSNSADFYLDYKSTFSPALWQDITGGCTNKTLVGLLLGGETSMWQDFYVPGARTKQAGSAHCLFDDSRDVDFHNLTLSTIWPRAGVAGGSFWNYNDRLNGSSAVFEKVVKQITLRLMERNVGACPCATTTSIGCDQNNYCGHVWCPGG